MSTLTSKFTQQKFNADSILSFEPGEMVFHEGDDKREMYVVLEGRIEVFKLNQREKGPSQEVLLATLGRGDFLGEMSLLESQPRSASARAQTPVKLLAIQPGGFLLKIRRDPTFAFEIMQALSRRIRLTNEALLAAINTKTITATDLEKVLETSEFQSASPSSVQPPATSVKAQAQ